MYNHKDATETLEIFTKALGAEETNTIDSWVDHSMVSAHFELGELQGSVTITSHFAPGSIRASIWHKGGNNYDIVRVTAPAAIALATVNMAIAQHTLDAASE